MALPPRSKSPRHPLRLYNDGKPKSKGQAAIDAYGYAWWRAGEDEPWQKAAFHRDLRAALIREAGQQGTYRTWTNSKGERVSRGDCGPRGTDDITSFHPQQNWTLDRNRRPPKTFQLRRTRETEPSYPLAQWIWREHVVLDYDGHPLVDFGALPATINSEEHGCFLEGMIREDPRISWHQVVARMPWKEVPNISTPSPRPVTRYGPVMSDNGGGMKRLRFRLYAGCIAWTDREGSDALRAQIEARLPPGCIQANSTRAMGRDFTKAEVKEIMKASQGKYPERAGKRALSAKEHKRVEDVQKKSMETKKRKAEEITDTQALKQTKRNYGSMSNHDTFLQQAESQEEEAEELDYEEDDHQHLTAPYHIQSSLNSFHDDVVETSIPGLQLYAASSPYLPAWEVSDEPPLIPAKHDSGLISQDDSSLPSVHWNN